MNLRKLSTDFLNNFVELSLGRKINFQKLRISSKTNTLWTKIITSTLQKRRIRLDLNK